MDFYTARQLDSVTVRYAVELGRQLAEWLNLTGGTKLVLRLLELDSKMGRLDQELTDYVEKLPDDGPESDDYSDSLSHELEALVEEFNVLISRCKIYPRLVDTGLWGDGWMFRWDLIRAPRKALKPDPRDHPRATLDDLDALLAIVRLAQLRYLFRVRKCPCEKWYFARIESQQFCAAKCRQWMFSKSERFRAHRREYMRKYYRLKMSGKVK